MLRSFFILMSKATWARRLITGWSFAWNAASRFIAGEKLEDAIRAIRQLNSKGIMATLDRLGEHTTNPEEAELATKDILHIFDVIDESGVRANVSIKLSQIGLLLDKGLCAENLRQILQHAQEKGNFVRIDMEDSLTVDDTLDLYHHMRETYHFDNTGLVIQSYLYRSAGDIEKIMAMGGKVRLCKGAYKEPDEVAFPKKQDVDENYDRLVKRIIDSTLSQGSPEFSPDGKHPPILAVASHDETRLTNAKAYAKQVGLSQKAIEFQMLYGIRRDLQEQTVQDGYQVRVYVPYGTEWYPYYMRRLAERPANVWFFVSNFFRR